MRRAIFAVAIAALLGVVLVFGAGEVLSRPEQRNIGQAPPDLHAETVRLATSPTESVSGWLARGYGRGSILLLHGVRADRTQMLDRARFLLAEGYSVLLIDLPAHGESSGKRITFGAHEAAGVTVALRYLADELPNERVGVIAVSLGAASLVLARPSLPLSAVVLESMYPTITDAVVNRLTIRLGPSGSFFAPLLLWQLPWRAGVSVKDLRPVAAVSNLRAPLLVASGTKDQHTPWPETERIFAAAKQPKELWAVQGAAHVDLCSYDPAAYKAHILKFFSKHLRN
jgi:fermentation-respiration switch protein FrsA (DUF1100 family)